MSHRITDISSPWQRLWDNDWSTLGLREVELYSLSLMSLSVAASHHTSVSVLLSHRLGERGSENTLNVLHTPLLPLITSYPVPELLTLYQDNDDGGFSKAMAQTIITTDNNLHSKSEMYSGITGAPISLASPQILGNEDLPRNWDRRCLLVNMPLPPANCHLREKPCQKVAKAKWSNPQRGQIPPLSQNKENNTQDSGHTEQDW